MSNLVFMDTARWMMLTDAADPLHEKALACRDHLLSSGGKLLSTNFVLDETLTLIRMRLGIDAAEKWWSLVDESPRVIWEWIDPPRLNNASQWFSGGGTRPFRLPTARASSS
jgi:hypothetical protein